MARSIPIGTVVRGGGETARALAELLPRGFETFQLAFPKTAPVPDLERLAEEVQSVLQHSPSRISALGVYGNPLRDDEYGEASRDGLRRAIQAARGFGTDVVGCFTGRIPGAPIPDCMPRFREVFAPLADLAGECGVRLAFEKCLQGGDWQRGDFNMAHHPAAWELIFDAVPGSNVGLEWEPCHQMCQLIDPLPQLSAWLPRIFHIHAKDAQVDRSLLAKAGICGPERWAWHRLPGFGDADWTDLFRILAAAGYHGAVDIEGFHDPVYRGDREIEGQLLSLAHLRKCRDAAAD